MRLRESGDCAVPGRQALEMEEQKTTVHSAAGLAYKKAAELGQAEAQVRAQWPPLGLALTRIKGLKWPRGNVFTLRTCKHPFGAFRKAKDCYVIRKEKSIVPKTRSMHAQ